MERLLAIFIVTVMLIALTACGVAPENTEQAQRPAKEYQVYLDQTLSSGCFNEDAGAHIWQDKKVTDNPTPNELNKSQTVNGANITVTYERTSTTSLGDTRHYYKSSDGKVMCVYRASDMSLAAIELSDLDVSEFMDMGLEEYNQYIKTFVSQYYTENWDDLSLMCLTHYYVESDDYLGRNVDHGFLTEFADNATLDTREFRYIKQYGGCQTTDNVKVLISIKEKTILIWFNDHKFDLQDVEIDHGKIDAAILEFLNDYLQEGVTLESYEKQGTKLMYSHGNLICEIDLNSVLVQNGERLEQNISFVVDIPDPV